LGEKLFFYNHSGIEVLANLDSLVASNAGALVDVFTSLVASYEGNSLDIGVIADKVDGVLLWDNK
jgi:hypothetical protein